MNTIATPTWVMREVARIAVNELKFARNVTKFTSSDFLVAGTKVGDTVYARLPQRFKISTGEGFAPQSLYDSTVAVTLQHNDHVDFDYSTVQATTDIQDIQKRYTKPAAEVLANQIDWRGLNQVYQSVPNFVGTPGTTPTTTLLYQQARARLADLAVPQKDLVAVLTPIDSITLQNAAITYFNPNATLTENYRSGQFSGPALGVKEWHEDQNVARHTTGTFTASTPLVNGAGQTGASIITDGWASGATTLKRGDTMTFGGVYDINPMSYSSTGQLKGWTLAQDAADTTGAITLVFTESFIPATSGSALANCSASPADNAVITVTGATSPTSGTLATTVTSQAMIYHPDAFIMAMADLSEDTPGAESKSFSDNQLGISMRMVRQFQIGNNFVGQKIEYLLGWTPFRPNWAVRIYGA